MMAPPDAAAGKLIEPETPAKDAPAKDAPIKEALAPEAPAKTAPEAVALAPPAADAEPEPAPATPPSPAVRRTEFAVDVGGANSVGGLRALWRGLLKSRSNAPLLALHPIIVVKEASTGLGMQLRLAAGPLSDAAAAAKICAAMIENQRPCETTVFDGQHLAMKADEDSPATSANPAAVKPTTAKPTAHRRSYARHANNEEPDKKPDPPSPSLSTTLSSYFGKH
jgi:hypothetical protein